MPKAKYEQIYRSLKRKIENNDYAFGSLLPSESTLIEAYDCSRNTVRRALAALTDEGYVQPIHGKGVRVIYQRQERTAFTVGGIETFRETVERNRLSASTKVIFFRCCEADEEIAALSGFPAGEQVYYLRRVRYLNGKPLILDINIFRASMVPNLTEEIAETSIYEYIEKRLGMQIATSKRRITVEHATELDEQVLDLGSYDCLAVISGQTFNADGIPFEYTQSRHHPDYFCFLDTATRRRPV